MGKINNPYFKSIEFDGFKNEAGSNSFSLTPKRWIESTNAIGIITKKGRYNSGTYAHFELLSKEYLQKTNFDEWTSRFANVLDVDVFSSKQYKNSEDTAYVKFGTKTWVDGEVEYRYYEGTWQTVLEDGAYKMLKSKIIEVAVPDYNWFYE